jgi:hypothetical protein
MHPNLGNEMHTKLKVLVLGASYGSLLASKIAIAGHDVSLVCTRKTADTINREGTLVRFPMKGQSAFADVSSKMLQGRLEALTPELVRAGAYDLVCLAMQEPQYGMHGIRELMAAIASCRVPCLSIMNMPPLPFLKRIPKLQFDGLEACYRDPELWQAFEPRLMTLCSPDPQAFRPNTTEPHVLQVGLATNFKAACFDDHAANDKLLTLERDIAQAQWIHNGEAVDLPVKLKVHPSIYVPLAKWCMLMTGNYRCVQAKSVCSIQTAVHQDVERSQQIYLWVMQLCLKLGATMQDLVPFEKYAAATQTLLKPSSVARSLAAGERHVERIDLLVDKLAQNMGMDTSLIAPTVTHVNAWVERNSQGPHQNLSQPAVGEVSEQAQPA